MENKLPNPKYFTLSLSDRSINEINQNKFIELMFSDLYIGGQSAQISEHKDNTLFCFQTIGHFMPKDLENIEKFVKNYGK